MSRALASTKSRAQLLGVLSIIGFAALLLLKATEAIDRETAILVASVPTALLVTGLVLVLRSSGEPGKHPAYRAYQRRMAVGGAAYLSAILLASGILPDDAPPTVPVIALALVPGVAVLAIIWAMGRLLIELDDEYLRLLEVRKFIVATGLLLAVASVWGLLEMFAQVPRLPIFYAFPIWCLGLIAGAGFNRRTMGDTGDCA